MLQVPSLNSFLEYSPIRDCINGWQIASSKGVGGGPQTGVQGYHLSLQMIGRNFKCVCALKLHSKLKLLAEGSLSTNTSGR